MYLIPSVAVLSVVLVELESDDTDVNDDESKEDTPCLHIPTCEAFTKRKDLSAESVVDVGELKSNEEESCPPWVVDETDLPVIVTLALIGKNLSLAAYQLID